VHGGSITTDIVVIKEDDDPERKSRWEKAFEKAYGLVLSEIEGQTLPYQLRTVANMRASAFHLFTLKDPINKDRRK
jgi:hypothetical protein